MAELTIKDAPFGTMFWVPICGVPNKAVSLGEWRSDQTDKAYICLSVEPSSVQKSASSMLKDDDTDLYLSEDACRSAIDRQETFETARNKILSLPFEQIVAIARTIGD